MTTPDLHDVPRTAITAELARDAEEKLRLVRADIETLQARLDESQHLEGLLVKWLADLGGGDAIPQPRSEQPAAPVGIPAPAPDVAEAPAKPARPARAAKKQGKAAVKPRRQPAAKATPTPPKAPAKKTPAKKAPAPVAVVEEPQAKAPKSGEPTVSERVLEFLTANPGPQKATEITAGLFGDDATQLVINQVRTTTERLVRRGLVEKEKQGGTVFYQASSVPAEAANATEEAEPKTAPADA